MEYNERIEKLAQQSYPQVALLKGYRGMLWHVAVITVVHISAPYP